MRSPYSIFASFFVIALLVGFTACKKEDKQEDTNPDNFNRGEMLSNIGDNLILPAYHSFQQSIDSLQIASNAFIDNPTSTSLTLLQASFINTYKAYQRVSAYEFGPAEEAGFRVNFNIFPCDTSAIKLKIENGDFNFDAASDIAVKGLPALDYLLHGANLNNTWVLNYFTTNVYAANAETYLNELVLQLKSKTDAVNYEWSSNGGNYNSIFKNSTGTDVGSSVSLLVNQLNYDLEILKNAKVGIPLGKQTLGTPQPSKTEALYCTQSLLLLKENLENLESIYLGRSALNIDGIGLDDYLESTGTMYGSVSLNSAIKEKFNSAQAKISLIPETLSSSVINQSSVVDDAYMELQQLVILLKVDLPSAIGVSITYVDNDGD